MKILIGVCGIGKGHCTRQYEIAKSLIKNGHEIKILTFGEGLSFFEDVKIPCIEVWVPFILYKNGRYDIKGILKNNINNILTGIYRNNRVYKEIIDNFKPDICISDYEPNVARIAYKIGVPFYIIDQQSKFMYLDIENIGGFTNLEEKKRLELFFPKFTKKFIISFYKINKELLAPNILVLPPIIKKSLVNKVENQDVKKIIVYFSEYVNHPIEQSLDEVVAIFSNFCEFNFHIYTHRSITTNYANVFIKRVSEKDFTKDIISATAVITTAGHTLISEALYLKIPVFVIPLPTFDQHYCARFISENKIGYSTNHISKDNLERFLNSIELYKNGIDSCKNLVESADTVSIIINELEKE